MTWLQCNRRTAPERGLILEQTHLKDKLMTALKAFISLGLMAYLFYRFLSDPLDRQVLLTTLTTANYWYLLLALALFVLAIISNG